MSGQAVIDRWRELILSEEQNELVASVRRHLADRFPLSAVRARFDAGPSDAGWDEVCSTGYPLIGASDSPDGVGSLTDLVALLEEVGRTLLPVPLLATVLSIQTRSVAGLPAESAPPKPAALGVGSGHASSTVTASRLSVLDGAAAQRLTLVIPDEHDTVVADVEQLPPPAIFSHVDPSRPLAVFDLDAVPVVEMRRVDANVDEVLRPARVALAADLVGVATGALERCVQHALDREQFGRKLGAFQALKHRLADIYVTVERARSLTRAAAIAVGVPGADPHDAVTLPLLAKAAAADAARAATAAFVQILGAMGMTFEADAHLYFRRAQQTAPFLGSASQCYQRAVREAHRG